MKRKYAIKMTYRNGEVAYMSVEGKTEWSKRKYAQRHIDNTVMYHGLKLELVVI